MICCSQNHEKIEKMQKATKVPTESYHATCIALGELLNLSNVKYKSYTIYDL